VWEYTLQLGEVGLLQWRDRRYKAGLGKKKTRVRFFAGQRARQELGSQSTIKLWRVNLSCSCPELPEAVSKLRRELGDASAEAARPAPARDKRRVLARAGAFEEQQRGREQIVLVLPTRKAKLRGAIAVAGQRPGRQSGVLACAERQTGVGVWSEAPERLRRGALSKTCAEQVRWAVLSGGPSERRAKCPPNGWPRPGCDVLND